MSLSRRLLPIALVALVALGAAACRDAAAPTDPRAPAALSIWPDGEFSTVLGAPVALALTVRSASGDTLPAPAGATVVSRDPATVPSRGAPRTRTRRRTAPTLADRMDTRTDEDLVAHGRRFAQIIAALLVITSVVTVAVYVARLGTGKLPQQAVRLLLTVGLAAGLARGRGWARWVTLAVVLLGMFVVVPVFRDPDAFRPARLGGTLAILALFVLYGVIGRGLLYSRSVRAYFRAAKDARATSGAPAA